MFVMGIFSILEGIKIAKNTSDQNQDEK